MSPAKIFQLGLGFWESKTFLSAVELGLFTVLAKGPREAEKLAETLQIHPRGARDFFDALVALGMLERSNGHYANTPESDFFLDRAKPSYVGGMLEMANNRTYHFWGSLTEALRTGQPQNESKSGNDFFQKLYGDPIRLKEFLSAMTALSAGANRAIAHQFPWDRYETFVDVGTAQGGLAVQVALRNGHIKGGGFDLPDVGPVFEEYVNRSGLSDRLQFHPGNFFKEPLPHADVLVFGHILHDWNLKEKCLLINKAYDALPSGGALIIFESLIDDERRRNAFGLLMSLNMLVVTHGGFDYTGADCCAWLRQAGFQQTRVEPLIGPDSMVIGIKP